MPPSRAFPPRPAIEYTDPRPLDVACTSSEVRETSWCLGSVPRSNVCIALTPEGLRDKFCLGESPSLPSQKPHRKTVTSEGPSPSPSRSPAQIYESVTFNCTLVNMALRVKKYIRTKFVEVCQNIITYVLFKRPIERPLAKPWGYMHPQRSTLMASCFWPLSAPISLEEAAVAMWRDKERRSRREKNHTHFTFPPLLKAIDPA